MATNKTITPTNVTVQIPAMSDPPDMSVPANAIDKAIDGINTLNSQINAHQFGSNTLANIQTAMVSFAQDMPDGGMNGIEFSISTASGKFGTTTYIGRLERIGASRLCVQVMCAMYDSQMIVGNYKDGTWYWDEVALYNQSAKKAEKRIAAGESAVFTFPNYQTAALIFCAAGNTNAALYIYSNGYLAPVATDPDVTVTLSQDYKTVTVTNPTSSRVFHVGCVSSNFVPTVT